MSGGRPSKYTEECSVQARKLCELGATDKDLADFFEVSLPTIWRWQSAHAEFCSALKVGKASADDRVERSLYHRANGYSFHALKIFQDKGTPVKVPYVEHLPPDTTACIFWLKNRRPDLWRDVTKHEHSLASSSDREIDELLALARRMAAAGEASGAGEADQGGAKPPSGLPPLH